MVKNKIQRSFGGIRAGNDCKGVIREDVWDRGGLPFQPTIIDLAMMGEGLK